jgi:hypothetical protein
MRLVLCTCWLYCVSKNTNQYLPQTMVPWISPRSTRKRFPEFFPQLWTPLNPPLSSSNCGPWTSYRELNIDHCSMVSSSTSYSCIPGTVNNVLMVQSGELHHQSLLIDRLASWCSHIKINVLCIFEVRSRAFDMELQFFSGSSVQKYKYDILVLF